jgi:asparagine synthase (glutamine-hydrolysing)
MVYRNRYWIIYNGEVYNFIELREELKKTGHDFYSGSDTEVILASYAEWGTSCFEKFRGMWGLLIVDAVRNEAILCRDRMGIKPLYVWQRADLIAVSSEIKQMLELPGFQPALNLQAASEFLLTGYEDPLQTFFDEVNSVPAGTWITINLANLTQSTPESYWHPERITIGIHDKAEAGRLFADKLRESVRLHLRSDVPVGCALSGGLDSTSIAVLINQLQQKSSNELHTFTVTFPGSNIDEKEYAEEVARHMHATQHFVTPDPQTFLDDLDRFLWIHDEPMGSLSIYASYCLARLTRNQNIPVTLNGQGGDEILSGYWQTYFLYLRELFLQGKWSTIARHYTGALLFGGNSELIRQTPVMFMRYQSRKRSKHQIRTQFMGMPTPQTLNNILSLQGQERRVHEIRTMFLPRLLKWDDRNSMAFGVEGRYPFLDHELIELSLSFSSETLYWNGWTKWPIRAGLFDKLPEKILKRRTKFGFEIPQNNWLCHSLRPTLENWLKQERPIHVLVNQRDIQGVAEETWNIQGKEDEVGQTLFRMFIFDRWLERFNVSCVL